MDAGAPGLHRPARRATSATMPDQTPPALTADTRTLEAILRIEARLDRLENRFDRFEERFRRVETDLLDLKGRVSQLPTAWTLLLGGAGVTFGIMAFALALVRIGVTQ